MLEEVPKKSFLETAKDKWCVPRDRAMKRLRGQARRKLVSRPGRPSVGGGERASAPPPASLRFLSPSPVLFSLCALLLHEESETRGRWFQGVWMSWSCFQKTHDFGNAFV